MKPIAPGKSRPRPTYVQDVIRLMRCSNEYLTADATWRRHDGVWSCISIRWQCVRQRAIVAGDGQTIHFDGDATGTPVGGHPRRGAESRCALEPPLQFYSSIPGMFHVDHVSSAVTLLSRLVRDTL